MLQVKKNRFDGEVGEVSLLFNADNKRYFEITPAERQQMLLTQGNYKAIIEARKAKYGRVEPELEPWTIDMKITNARGQLKPIL